MFSEFKKLPPGAFIKYRNQIIPLGIELPKEIAAIIHSVESPVFFTRMSLKHISEKSNIDKRIFDRVYKALKTPDLIHKNHRGRFLFSKTFHEDEKPYPLAVSLEVNLKNIVVTAFTTNESYLRNFEILWRTETLANGPSIST